MTFLRLRRRRFLLVSSRGLGGFTGGSGEVSFVSGKDTVKRFFVGANPCVMYSDLIKKNVCSAKKSSPVVRQVGGGTSDPSPKVLLLWSRSATSDGGVCGAETKRRCARPLRRASLATSPASRGGQKPSAKSRIGT